MHWGVSSSRNFIHGLALSTSSRLLFPLFAMSGNSYGWGHHISESTNTYPRYQRVRWHFQPWWCLTTVTIALKGTELAIKPSSTSWRCTFMTHAKIPLDLSNRSNLNQLRRYFLTKKDKRGTCMLLSASKLSSHAWKSMRAGSCSTWKPCMHENSQTASWTFWVPQPHLVIHLCGHALGAALASLSVGGGGSPTLITNFTHITWKLFTNCHERRICKETIHKNCKNYSQKLWWNGPN